MLNHAWQYAKVVIKVLSLDNIIRVHIAFICIKFSILLYYIYNNVHHLIRCKHHNVHTYNSCVKKPIKDRIY